LTPVIAYFGVLLVYVFVVEIDVVLSLVPVELVEAYLFFSLHPQTEITQI
jgi:hypothetical protein